MQKKGTPSNSENPPSDDEGEDPSSDPDFKESFKSQMDVSWRRFSRCYQVSNPAFETPTCSFTEGSTLMVKGLVSSWGSMSMFRFCLDRSLFVHMHRPPSTLHQLKLSTGACTEHRTDDTSPAVTYVPTDPGEPDRWRGRLCTKCPWSLVARSFECVVTRRLGAGQGDTLCSSAGAAFTKPEVLLPRCTSGLITWDCNRQAHPATI